MHIKLIVKNGRMAKLVYALASGASSSDTVEVQVLFRPLLSSKSISKGSSPFAGANKDLKIDFDRLLQMK